jgi:hypothetical protein
MTVHLKFKHCSPATNHGQVMCGVTVLRCRSASVRLWARARKAGALECRRSDAPGISMEAAEPLGVVGTRLGLFITNRTSGSKRLRSLARRD